MINGKQKTTIGVDANIAGFLCYLLGWISGLALFLIEKDNVTVRFHAMQSMITFGSITIICIASSAFHSLGIFVLPIINIIGVVLWILLMIKVYQGQRYKLPVIGEMAEDWMNKFSS